ncbi:hypothetical protein [Streptoalloteichus hindustanus]|uniref:Glycosyl transferase family 2 n=1 Tax=Streptoalloteichus hindustanus TaxID=2017 RepID=A0A1M5IHL5_STRHI|nr:hypothetical protein [Streptoalloteichus hindustanus]SHG27410.1 hypothetical protein SAMN05444320_107275 [Streptoalloteichus hindustanus]
MPLTHEVAVVLTCDPDQGHLPPTVLSSVDRQEPAPVERLLVPHGCRTLPDLPSTWQVMWGEWPHPAQMRNQAMARTSAPWVMFTNADQLLPAEAVAATLSAIGRSGNETGVVYQEDNAPRHDSSPPRAGQDYWRLRIGDHEPRRSTWRRSAVELVGGWSDRCDRLLDHALLLDITEAGWHALRLDAPAGHSAVPPPEAGQTVDGSEAVLAHDRWQARSLAVVSLHAGREATFPRWERFLSNADLPRKTSLYVVDNSGRRDFTTRIHDACSRIAETRGLTHVDVSVNTTTYQPRPDDDHMARGRNLQVARLYTSLLPRVREDLVLTLEDDIDPPLSAVRRLGQTITGTRGGPVGVVAAAWDRVADRYVSAGRGVDGIDGRWGESITWAELSDEPSDAACVGGACTMWTNSVLSQVPVNFRWNDDGKGRRGWDGLLCAEMRRRGFRVLVHGGVRCLHHTGGEIRDAVD